MANIILNDIDTGYMNATYYNKILYSFKDNAGSKSYKINDNLCIKSGVPSGDIGDPTYTTTEGYVSSNCSGLNYRQKKELSINDRKKVCKVENDATGTTYIVE